MELNPGPQLLFAMRSQALSWHDLLSELIDNSFDAGATRVHIEFSRRRVSVSDDGAGCNDIQKMLTLGKHYRQRTTRLGRYGVGLKDAACCLWGQLDILTAYRNERRSVLIDWAKLAKRDDWMVPDPIVQPNEGASGTILTFSSIDKPLPGNYDRLSADLGYTFMPAVQRGGCQIIVSSSRRNAAPVVPYSMPPLEHIVEDEFQLSDDSKRVRLRAGVVKEGHDNPKAGFTFTHGHRVIQNSSLGSKGNSTARVAGTVELIDGWTLSKNKTALIDDDAILEAAIYQRCQTIFEVGERQATQICGSAFDDALNAAFQSRLETLSGHADKKEKRESPSNNSGTVAPANTKAKRKRAKKTQPGEAIGEAARRFAKCGRIEWKTFDRSTTGSVDVMGNCIWLNDAHESLSSLRVNHNVEACLSVALGMLSYQAMQDGNRNRLPFFKTCEDFFNAWALILNDTVAS